LQFLVFLSLDQPIFAKQIKIVPKLLHIDTTGETALIGLSIHNEIIAERSNTAANQHASFVQIAIQAICQEHAFDLNELDAIVVTLGPGSYTGMRVGLSSAKGIAYALDKPLIGLSSLALLAKAGKKQVPNTRNEAYSLFSMIDARRMEVFGALYDHQENALTEEQAIVLDTDYLKNLIQKGRVYCIGSGASKTSQLIEDDRIQILPNSYSIAEMLEFAMDRWQQQQFEDLAYVGPTYIKEFYSIPPKTAL
jgi:tRNA threonylcarbamoyladenosine biosynthesis protein TsaB